ncbi:hypothetical protein C4D60_Mb02t13110 [Musa balbisiana]|uniref:Uncharacterized protein n=1 Tax=Musa balbisiana TaxID=52838 RepID=A0A4S8IBP2_MUSBA|nr:hypothetical protein C4D60_Mb02t13110 [Musa balbisiana]
MLPLPPYTLLPLSLPLFSVNRLNTPLHFLLLLLLTVYKQGHAMSHTSDETHSCSHSLICHSPAPIHHRTPSTPLLLFLLPLLLFFLLPPSRRVILFHYLIPFSSSSFLFLHLLRFFLPRPPTSSTASSSSLLFLLTQVVTKAAYLNDKLECTGNIGIAANDDHNVHIANSHVKKGAASNLPNRAST